MEKKNYLAKSHKKGAAASAAMLRAKVAGAAAAESAESATETLGGAPADEEGKRKFTRENSSRTSS